MKDTRMHQSKTIPPDHDERSAILKAVGLNDDEPLMIAVEEMIAQARSERPTHPKWYALSGRNAQGIRAIREALEAQSGWARAITQNRLEGVQHLGSGRFLAVHNTCERTGLNKGLPRFMSERKRAATKSLQDDLQGDFCELVEDFEPTETEITPEDERTLHLCVYIEREAFDTGEDILTARAELVIGATCSDLGITGCKYRLPLDLSGMVGSERVPAPRGEEAVEAEISIRRKS